LLGTDSVRRNLADSVFSASLFCRLSCMFAFVIKSFSRIIPKSVPNQNISMKHYKNDVEFVIHKTLIKKIQYVFKGEKGEVSTIWI
jgi:hypothetical protein